MKNFIKIPYIKFRKSCLHNWAKRKYITSENKKQDRIDASFLKYATLYEKGKESDAQRLNEVYSFDPVANTLYNLIKGFTYKEVDNNAISNLINTLAIVGIEAKIVDDVLFVQSEEISFYVNKLSKYEPRILRQLPDIEYPTRGGKCHPYGVITTLCFANNKNFETNFVTGRIYQMSPKAKYLHSWVEISDGEKEFVIDATRNAIYSKEAFYYINHVGETARVHSSKLKEDYEMIRKLTDYDNIAVKIYYENPEKGRKLYKKLVSLGEIEASPQIEK